MRHAVIIGALYATWTEERVTVGDRDLPDGAQGDGPADAGEPAKAESPDATSPGQQRARRMWIGTWTAVGAAVAADASYTYTRSWFRGLLALLLMLAAGGMISLVLYHWPVRDGTPRDLGRPRVRPVGVHATRPGQARPIGTAPPLTQPAKSDGAAPEQPSKAFVRRGVVAVTALAVLIGLGYGVGAAFSRGIAWGFPALAVVVAIALAGIVRLSGRVYGRRWPALACTGAAAVAVLVSGAAFGRANPLPACPVPTELRLLASSEDFGAVQDAVQAADPGFEQWLQGQRGSSCYAVDVTVYAETDNQATISAFTQWEEGMDNGTGLVPDPRTGPPPDIWIPDSPAEMNAVLGSWPDGRGTRTLDDLGSIGDSPVVIAVPERLVDATLANLGQGATWPAIYGALADAGIGLALPDPQLSDTGLFGVTGLYRAPMSVPDERAIESAGDFPPDSADLLCADGQAAGQGKTAYLVSEAAMASYNAGKLTGGACATPGQPEQLVPFYPKGTAALTFPFITVNWGHDQDSAARVLARELYDWLTGPGHDTLGQGGIRPGGCMIDGILGQSDVDQSYPSCGASQPPPADEQSAALQAFKAARVPSHVLIGIDDSGPMGLYLPQITSAIDTVFAAPVSDARDRFAIWELPGPHGQTSTALVNLESATAANRAKAAASVGTLTGHDHSANYDMLTNAAKVLYESSASQANPNGPPVNSVVLLTDGDYYNPAPDPDAGTLKSVTGLFKAPPPGSRPITVYVIAFGPPGCTPPLHQLAKSTGGTCSAASQFDPVHLLGQILGQILGWG